jgi:RNA polymerase sigma-70 factor, ECF subfamily
LDRGDFEAIVRDHAKIMAAAIRRVCGHRHRALVQDLQQEVYLALWKRLGNGKKIDFPVSYIYKVALTTALAAVRKLKLRPEVPIEEADIAPSVNPRELTPPERARMLEEALVRLDPDEARAVRAHLAGFNHREVAALYGWTESTARHRIYRSIRTLAEKMNAHAEIEDEDGR